MKLVLPLMLIVMAFTARAADTERAVAAPMATWNQSGHVTTLTAQSVKSPKDQYTLEVAFAPNTAATEFREQSPVYRSARTVTLSHNGIAGQPLLTTEYFLVNPYVPVGRVVGTGSPYAVIVHAYELPKSVNGPASGNLYDMTWYHDNDMSVVDGYIIGTYQVALAEGNAVEVCVTETVARVTATGAKDGLGNSSQTSCHRIDTAGKVTLVSVAMPVGDEILTFR